LAGSPLNSCVVLLAHQPTNARDFSEAGADLVLSGHTHGGQFFPWNVVFGWFLPWISGLYDIDGMKLYVSRGTGWWGPPLRIGSRTEITRITLRPSDHPTSGG